MIDAKNVQITAGGIPIVGVAGDTFIVEPRERGINHPTTPIDRGPWTIERLAETDGVYAVRMYTEAGGQEEAGDMGQWIGCIVAAEGFLARMAQPSGNVQILINESQRVRVAWQGSDRIVIVHGSNCKATKAMPRTIARLFANAAKRARGEKVRAGRPSA